MSTSQPSDRKRYRIARTVFAMAAALAVGCSLTSCAVGPDFVKPPAPHVAQFVHGQPEQDVIAAERGSQRFDAEAQLPTDWWTLFGSRVIDTAVSDTLMGNATLDGAQASLRQSEASMRAGAGVFFPQVDAGFGASREKYSPLHVGQDLPPTIFNLFTLSGTISYTLDLWGGERRLVEGLRAQTDVARYALLATYLTLTTNVVNAMIARAAYTDEIAATRETIDLVREQVRITRTQAEAGTTAYSAVLTLESELATLEASLPALEQKRVQTQDLLATLAGEFPADWHADAVSLSDIALPADLPAAIPSELVHRRPDILQAEAALHVASANVGVATANLFPSLTLSATGGYGNSSMGALLRAVGQTWSLGGSISAPIFHGGSLWYQRKAALAALDGSRSAYRQIVLTAFAQVADTLRALEHDAAALDAQARALASAREALRLMRVNYEAGTVDYVQILVADQQYHQAEIAYLQDLAQRLQDTVALYAALGGGWGTAH
ncbi:efflux transporter outer membrane subunit [Trinickia dinghuensis]|uniref:RND transporter n=1 Tax=Trinickia dinghuensis TaxID=2291023 RepID=A0A3D8K406_9BURK|nr:efflux transporter outer membrane subunit [Trinickia dinghuensis]RDU99341.1 RND transporter [Trinickia dinghuensis]